MRTFRLVIVFLLLVLTACHRPVETHHGTSLHPELAAIDTLMQTRPDSALTLLLDKPMDDPYYQLLLSEVLYKNNYAQTNRTELLAAMAHFDSLCSRDGVHAVSTNDLFLAARCHYMNGVGYYEMDSVVAACAEYLKALETMEEQFEEKDLVGYKAKFMALTYTHVCQLFSDQYFHEQAIHFGKCSLPYYHKYNAEPWHVAWILREMGSQYAMLKEWDSVTYYCNKAIEVLPDTNNLTYRDITTLQSILSYSIGEAPQKTLEQLRRLLCQAENEQEYLARCLNIGEFFYDEKEYDSAWIYLNKVFNESIRINPKKQAAEWLIDICKIQGKDDEILEYASFLAPFTNQEENKSELKSQLTELYKTYNQKKMERQHLDKIRQNTKLVTAIVAVLLIVMLTIVILYHNNKKKKQNLEVQIKEEKLAHEIKQRALSGRLKKSNETLKEALKKNEEQETPKATCKKEDRSQTIKWYEDFKRTPICQEIFDKVEQLHGDKRMTLKTDMDIACYKSFALSTTQLVLLSKTVEEYFPDLYASLKTWYPSLGPKEWRLCILYLLQLDKLSICVLLQEPYHTCRRYTLKLEQAFQCEHGLPTFLLEQVL